MKYTFILITLMVLSIPLVAQDAGALRKKHFNLDNGLAIKGYDPVAYFTQSKAVKGKKELAVSYLGTLYHFSSETNKEIFKAAPFKYEPEYGGWCAYAMGQSGEKVPVDPETFKVLNGKLYLFYNRYFTNTLKDWNKNEAALKKKADLNWPSLFK
ncbi:MAG: YHS domain-containing protein [Ferruginibacter sp.]|nr:YHS domain-containing protein [Ferruginibacter sp.]